jgi:hypothetical protein
VITTISIVEVAHFINRTYIKPKQEVKKINASFAFIEKGVITQRKGGLFPIDQNEPFSWNSSAAATGIEFLKDKKDTSQFLIFSIENNNERPIKNLGANISIDPTIYSAIDPIFHQNCSWNHDGNTIHMKITELFPMQSSLVIIPLTTPKIKIVFRKPEEEKRYISETKICSVSAWYEDLSLKISGSKAILVMDK